MDCLRAAVLVLSCIFLSSCGIDREYRLRFWEKCRIGAAQALHKKQYKFARVLADEAVAQAQGFGDSDFRLGVSLCGLGDVEKAQGKRKSAEQSYKRAVKVLEAAENKAAEQETANMNSGKKSAMADSDLTRRLAREDLANALSHLADLYATEERYSEAANCFERAAQTYQSMITGNKWTVDDCPLGQELVYSLLGLAQVSIQEKKLTVAADAYQRSLVYAVASNCPEFLLVEIRDGYLKVLQELGRTAETQQLLADSQCTKFVFAGTQAFARKDFAGAEKLFQQAYVFAQQSIFANRRIMHCLYSLTMAYSNLGKIAELQQTCRLADQYMLSRQLRFDKDYDGILTADADTAIMYGIPTHAIEALSKQYRFRVVEYGPNSIPVCDTMIAKAKAEFRAGNLPSAEKTAIAVYRVLTSKHLSNKRAGHAILDTAILLGMLGHPDLDFELQEGFLNTNLKRMDPTDGRVVAYQATVFVEYAKYGEHDKALKIANSIADVLKKAKSEQRAESFKYLVLMMSYCRAKGWFDVAEPIAEIGQSVLLKEFQDQLPDEAALINWPKDIALMEKHFGRKF